MALGAYSLSGIPTRGPKYTRSNHRQGEDVTKEKVNRPLANPKCMEIFSSSYCQFILALRSDHCPLFISISSKSDIPRKKLYLFKYEACWDLNEDCSEIF